MNDNEFMSWSILSYSSCFWRTKEWIKVLWLVQIVINMIGFILSTWTSASLIGINVWLSNELEGLVTRHMIWLMLYILVEFQIIGTTGINIDMLFLFFQYKEWYFLWLVIFIMDLRVSWGKCCWDCLNHFPQVREFLIFEWWGGFETTIGAVVFEKSAASQEFHHRNFIFWFLIFNFLGPFLYCLEQ